MAMFYALFVQLAGTAFAFTGHVRGFSSSDSRQLHESDSFKSESKNSFCHLYHIPSLACCAKHLKRRIRKL